MSSEEDAKFNKNPLITKGSKRSLGSKRSIGSEKDSKNSKDSKEQIGYTSEIYCAKFKNVTIVEKSLDEEYGDYLIGESRYR